MSHFARFIYLLFACLGWAFSPGLLAQSTPDALARIAHDFLLEQAQALPGIPQVHIDASRLRPQAECPEIHAFLANGQQLRTRMSIGLKCLGTPGWSISVPASLNIQGYYYVSNRTINVGDLISQDDLLAREGDLLRLPAGVPHDPSLIIGNAAKQRIPAGSIIRSTVLRDPEAVVRGQSVRTLARGVGFTISGEGQALQTGSPGRQIQVRTPSGQVISATVLNSGTVQVLM